jgi:transcriptional regulator with XRE-family HTH domain
MTESKNWGPYLAGIRRRKELKAEPLAHQIGVSASTLSKIETGKCGLRLDLFLKYVDALKLSKEDLSDPEGAEILATLDLLERVKNPVVADSAILPPLSSRDPDSLINRQQTAVFLRMSLKTLYRRVKDGFLAAVRVARNVRFRVRDVLEYSRKYKDTCRRVRRGQLSPGASETL